MAKMKTFGDGIIRLQHKAEEGAMSIGEIFRLLSGSGRTLSLIFLSIPFCQPLQIPGMAIPFGLMISFIGFRMLLGKRIWLPKKMLDKKITKRHLLKITGKALYWLNKLKHLTHPRLHWVCSNKGMVISHILSIIVLGILLALPLPIPLSNIAAAWGIFLIALGLLEGDGLFVLLGYVVFLVTILFFVGITLSLNHFLQVR